MKQITASLAIALPTRPSILTALETLGIGTVGGLLFLWAHLPGGLITGRASGAAAGAVIGGLTGATAAAREGYWMSNGGCYYRYPSGQYVVADPRWCY